MHLHIGGGIILIVGLVIVAIILTIGYVVRASRRPVVAPPAPPRYDNGYSRPAAPGGYTGYPPVGGGFVQPQGIGYVAPQSGISTGEALVGGLVAGALLEAALTPRATIIENGAYGDRVGGYPAQEIGEVVPGQQTDNGFFDAGVDTAAAAAPAKSGGFWSLDFSSDNKPADDSARMDYDPPPSSDDE